MSSFATTASKAPAFWSVDLSCFSHDNETTTGKLAGINKNNNTRDNRLVYGATRLFFSLERANGNQLTEFRPFSRST